MCFAWERECPFYGLCTSDMATWPAQIEQFFEVRDDDPKKKGEKKDEQTKSD
jgi:hypothetical protein